MSTAGSLMIPFWTPKSQWSNQRWIVSTHTARRPSNGSTWPWRMIHSLRGTLRSLRPYHHLEKWSARTFSSLTPCVMKTLALTLSRSFR